MESCTLSGRSILIAEDEPLIALDIAEVFKRVGAAIVVTSTVQHALVLVEHDDLSAYRVVRRRQRPRPTRSRSSLKPVSGRRRSRDGWMWAGRASIERSATPPERPANARILPCTPSRFRPFPRDEIALRPRTNLGGNGIGPPFRASK